MNDNMVMNVMKNKNFYKNSANDPKTIQLQSQQLDNKVTYQKLQKSLATGKNIWIIKPSDYNRGRGIKVFSNLNQLNQILKDYAKDYLEIDDKKPQVINNGNSYNMKQSLKYHVSSLFSAKNTYLNPNQKKQKKVRKYVIQKYIESPLLINKRKFDIRIWVLITNNLKLYVFKEGYIRTASYEYTVSNQNLDNEYIHLTNNAIQKNCQEYSKFEQGNQLSFQQFQEYLDGQKIQTSIYNDLFPKMKKIINLTFDSCKNKINLHNRQGCFEIFGYDFIIDSELNTWLIEVNTNPCLEESSTLLQKLLPRMIDDAFKLTLDKRFKQPQNTNKKHSKQQFPVPDYQNEENMWEYLNFKNKFNDDFNSQSTQDNEH